MKELVTDVLELDAFDEATMDSQIGYATVFGNTVIFHFRDGHEAKLSFKKKRHSAKWSDERREKQCRTMKASWTDERRAAASQRMKKLRSEKKWPKR